MLKVAQILVESRNKGSYEEAKRELHTILAEYHTYIIAEVNNFQISNLKGR